LSGHGLSPLRGANAPPRRHYGAAPDAPQGVSAPTTSARTTRCGSRWSTATASSSIACFRGRGRWRSCEVKHAGAAACVTGSSPGAFEKRRVFLSNRFAACSNIRPVQHPPSANPC
jgi:hypothetical protein